MPKSDLAGAPSLLPYLEPHQPGISLKFDLPGAPGSPDAFAAGDPCGPFTIMRTAKVVFDGKEQVTAVMALTQADNYLFTASELNPICNPDVEMTWQTAWGKSRKTDGTRFSPAELLALPSQVGPDGALVPLRPLFYCRHVDRYGHGLCPFCGQALDLCRQDDLLARAELPAFSGSLQRYLFCPDCHHGSTEAPFYQHPLPEKAPVRVLGCNALIEDFSRLLAKTDLAGDLPCIGCSEAAVCYGAETLVLQRMTPVQFYPFHMLLQQAPSLNAIDFLPLLAGAASDEIERILAREQNYNRLQLVRQAAEGMPPGSGFLFGGDQRHFLEVLHLKLSFLHDLLGLVGTGTGAPANRMSMEGVGVSLALTGSRLPFFWNFKLKLIDPVGQPPGNPMGTSTVHRLTLELLGAAWFYVLLVNARQPMKAIREVLAALQQENISEQGALPALIDPALAPGNIFWQPATLELQDSWRTLWLKAIELGVRVLHAGKSAEQNLVLQEVGKQLEDLKALVRENLFEAFSEPISDHTEADQPAADKEIARILTTLLDQWPSEPSAAIEKVRDDTSGRTTPAMEIQPNEDGDFEETVILSTSNGSTDNSDEQPAEPVLEKTVLISPSADPDEDTGLEKTVVLGPSPAGPSTPEEDEIEKTVVIKSPAQAAGPADPDKTVVVSVPGNQAAEDNLDKTVVIGEPRGKKLMDALEKTVVQKHGGQQPSPPGKKTGDEADSGSDEADDLDATIIQPPKGGRDRKPKP